MIITRYRNGKKQVFELPEASRQRIVNGLKTRKISPNVISHFSNLNKGKTGKNHPCWKECKKRPLYQAIRQLYEYREWRKKIYNRDNYTCVLCGKRGGDKQADHFPKRFIDIIKEFSIDTIDKAQNCNALWIAEGRTLCIKCHRNTFNWGRNFHAKRLSEKTS
jgi:hypothetical protein